MFCMSRISFFAALLHVSLVPPSEKAFFFIFAKRRTQKLRKFQALKEEKLKQIITLRAWDSLDRT